jgi:hypothetical protein
MFLTNKRVTLPENILIKGNAIEVVHSFRLLGVIIDENMNFKEHITNLKKVVNTKLFSIKRIFYLSAKVKLQFFKTFILPHFDYCLAMIIYMCPTQISRIERFFNICIYRLLRIELVGDCENQAKILEERKTNLLPYKYRICSRLSIFCHKIANKQILKPFSEELIVNETLSLREREIMVLPDIRTECGRRSVKYFVPKFINKVIQRNYNQKVLKDFITYIYTNISDLYKKYNKHFFVKTDYVNNIKQFKYT